MLEREIREEISGSHRNFLLALLKANRSSNPTSDARTERLVHLLDRFESSGNEELLDRINEAFAFESFAQLKAAFNKKGNMEMLFDSLSGDHMNAMETFSMGCSS